MKLAVSGAHFRYHVVLSKQCMRLWCLVSSHTWPCNEDVCVCVCRAFCFQAKMTSLEAHAYDKSTIQSPAASIKSAPSKGGGLFGRRRRATEDD